MKFEDGRVIIQIASRLFDLIRTRKFGAGATSFYAVKESVAAMAYGEQLWVCKSKDTNHILGAVAFSVVKPWWSNKTCLDELFVLRLDESCFGFGRMACDFMKKKAKAYGCSFMETGVSITDNPGAMRNTYERYGECSFSYPNFVWLLRD